MMNVDASGQLHTGPHLDMRLVASMPRELGLELIDLIPQQWHKIDTIAI
jgi:hypothetical protein